jgi:putative cardiolipin synthase
MSRWLMTCGKRRSAAPRRLLSAGAGLAVAAALIAGCASLPGADYPRVSSVALANPEDTKLGAQFAVAVKLHDGNSGFRILTAGVDGFLTRVEMIGSAQKSLDLQYFIFRGDETGRLLADALVRAADRGVRIRVLVDDGDTVPGDEQIAALDAHPSIEVRIFNPFGYRGHIRAIRSLDFLFNRSRLDYRMHNKLLVVDNSVALIGGRNIGNQYFQMDPRSQFADDDVFSAGPIARRLSATFDEYWNSGLAIPVKALGSSGTKPDDLAQHRMAGRRGQEMQPLESPGLNYVALIATGEPYAGMVSGRLPLIWAPAIVICDSPHKEKVASGAATGRLMEQAVAAAARGVKSELLMVTPYFVPSADELQLLTDLRARQVKVRVLTNSLESAPDLLAQSGYMEFRVSLLNQGVDLHEARALLGNVHGSGQTKRMSSYGTYALHAKIFVFDRRQVFMGSMNFDQRSKRLNTEIGLIIDSPELAQQTALRFEGMVQPENAYSVELRGKRRLVWATREDGKDVEYDHEPARSEGERLQVKLLSFLPLDREL